MAIPSKEHAKTRLEEFRTILKYMPFLQKNGLSDCGRGQIIGQIHLLQEFLNEKQVNNEIINTQQENSSINSNSNSNNNSNIIVQDDASITDAVSSLPQFYEPAKQEITRSSTTDTNSKDNTFDIDNLILEDDRNPNEENKLLGSRWLRPFKNDENEKKKPLDYFDKNEITQSWKEKIRKMTQSDII